MKLVKDDDAWVRVVQLENPDDERDRLHFLHRITHSMGWVAIQVWNKDGQHMPLPGAGHTPYQNGNGVVHIPVLNRDHYPITVVMFG